jgi:hypothetical protein
MVFGNLISRRGALAVAMGGLLGLGYATPASASAPASASTTASPTTASFVLDGVHLSVSAPYLPGAFTAANPSSRLQQASANLYSPYRSVAVVSVPFGTQPNETAVPVARAGGSSTYMRSLAAYASANGAPSVIPSASANLFGHVVQGEEARELQPYDGITPVHADTAYWVVQEGQRLWIVSAIREQKNAGAPLANFSGLSLSSPDPNVPSAMLRALSTPPGTNAATAIYAPGYDLPHPSWFTGTSGGPCAANAHWNTTAKQLSSSATWLNVAACGPPPGVNCGSGFSGNCAAVPAAKAPNQWQGFQCSELSSRFMWLAYGIYAAGNGDAIAMNAGTHTTVMKYYKNGTVGILPLEGDVVSESDSGAGHTYVITGTDITNQAAGDAIVGLIEENGSSAGYRTETVTGWKLADSWDGENVEGWAAPLNGGPGQGTSYNNCPLVGWVTGHFTFGTQPATVEVLLYGYISEHDITLDCFGSQLVLQTGADSFSGATGDISAYYSNGGGWVYWEDDPISVAPPARDEFSMAHTFISPGPNGSPGECLLANDVGNYLSDANGKIYSVANGLIPNIAVDVCQTP